MKEILLDLAGYNLWANTLLADCCSQLPEALLEQTFAGSFGSIRDTVLHMLDAESIWWQRIKLQDSIIRPGDGFIGSTADAFKLLKQQDESWKSWIEHASIAALQHEFSYRNTKREKFTQPTYQVLLHLFNHGTYHRGQLVNHLHNVDFHKIPPTDYIVYTRGRK